MGIIGSIRKHSWLAVAIVGIAIVAFIIGDLTKNTNSIPDMGKIDGTTITAQNFNDRMAEVEANYKRQSGIDQIPSEIEYSLREQLWQTIVDETLMGQEYDAMGLTVTDLELSDMYGGQFIHPYIRQQFTNPQTGQFDKAQVDYIINNFDKLDTNMRMQWVELEKQVRTDRQMQKYTQLMLQGFYMPSTIAADIAQIGTDSRDALVAALPYSELADAEAQLTDKDYQQYYNKHKEEFRIHEEIRNIDMVVFNVVPTEEDLQTIQEEVYTVWDTFQITEAEEIPYFVNSESDHSYDSSYRKPSQLEAGIDSLITPLSAGQFVSPRIIGNEWIMAKVLDIAYRPDSLRASVIYILNERAGGNVSRSDEVAQKMADSIATLITTGRTTFAAAVNDFSDDPQKGETQGDMGWQLDGNYGFINEQLVNTPVNGVFVQKHPAEVGYMIVQVTGKTTPNKKYRVALITREINPSENTMRNIYEQAHNFAASNRTYQELQATAAAKGMQVRSAQTLLMMPNVNGVPNSRDIVQWAFNEKTELGSVADKVFESDNMYVVVALRDVFKKGYATLEQARPMIDNQVRIEKKSEVLLARAREAMQGSGDMASIAAKLGVSVDTVSNITFNSYYFGQYGMEPKLQGAVAVAAPNKAIGPIKGAQGVYVAAVAATHEAEAASPDQVRMEYQQGYMQKGRMLSTVLRNNAIIIDQRNKFF